MRLPFHLLALTRTTVPWRQAGCAAAGVGLSVLSALWLHNRYGVLFGAVGALYASLLDFGGTLGHRVLTQATGLVLVATCAVLGALLGPHHIALWIVLASLTFGVGWVDGTGVALETILRFAVLMLLVYAFLPSLPAAGLPFFGIGMVVGLTMVWLDSLIWPRAVPTEHDGLLAAVRQIRGGYSAGWQHAFCFSITTCAALAIALALHYQRPAWVTAVTLFVIRREGPDSLHRLVQSVFGTMVGIAIAWCVAHRFHDDALLLSCVVALAFLRPIGRAFNPWAQSASLTALILVLFDAALGSEGHAASLALLRIRLFDVMLGSIVALCGMLLFNPSARAHLWKKRQVELAALGESPGKPGR